MSPCESSCEAAGREAGMSGSQAIAGGSTQDAAQNDAPHAPAAEVAVPAVDTRWNSRMVPDAEPGKVPGRRRSRLRAFLAALRSRSHAAGTVASCDEAHASEAGDPSTSCCDTERGATPLGSSEAAAPAQPACDPSMEQHPGAASAQEQVSRMSSSGGSSCKECEASCSAPQQDIQEGVDWAEMNRSMMHSLHHMITGIITATIARVCAFVLSPASPHARGFSGLYLLSPAAVSMGGSSLHSFRCRVCLVLHHLLSAGCWLRRGWACREWSSK